MKKMLMANRAVHALLIVIGGGLALFRLFGYLFFISSLSFWIVVPALIMFAVILLPTQLLAEQRWLIFFLFGIYIASYVFGGLDRIFMDGEVMPDSIEFPIVFYFLTKAYIRYRQEMQKTAKVI